LSMLQGVICEPAIRPTCSQLSRDIWSGKLRGQPRGLTDYVLSLEISMHRQRLAAVLAAGLLTAHPAARPATTSDQETAQALQKKYAAIKDFSADFVHVYEGGVLKKKVTEQGHVLIKKPGRMRWEYTSPEPKLFVSDGSKLYSYIPQDKQVFVAT